MRKGDIVKIKDDGYVYTTYTKMAEKLGASMDWAYNEIPKNGMLCEVLNLTKTSWRTNYEEVILIRCMKTSKEYLIGKKGLELWISVERRSDFIQLTDEDFLI